MSSFAPRTAFRPSVAVTGVGRSATGGLEAVLQAAEPRSSRSRTGGADLVVLVCDDHADPRLPDRLTELARRSPVLLVRWGAGRSWIGPLIGADKAPGNRFLPRLPGGGVARQRRPDLAGAAHPVGAGGAVLRSAAVGAVAGAVDGVLEDLAGAGSGTVADVWRAGVRELRLRTAEVVVHPVPPCPRTDPARSHGTPRPTTTSPAGSTGSCPV